MIVVKNQFVPDLEESLGPVIVVEKTQEGYRLSRINASEGSSLDVAVSDVEPWGRRLFFWSFYGEGFIEASNYEDSRDCDNFMRSRFGCTEGPVVIAARGGNDDLVLVCTVPTHSKEPHLTHGFGPSIDAVEMAIPGYKASARARANKAKRDLLERINPINMLAEQEKQIDLLALLVLELLDKQPEAGRPVWAADFKAIVEQHGSTQFKGVSGALADVAERKANMRQLQREYFVARNGAV